MAVNVPVQITADVVGIGMDINLNMSVVPEFAAVMKRVAVHMTASALKVLAWWKEDQANVYT